MSEGMKDLGALPHKIDYLENRNTGVRLYQSGALPDVWIAQVRFAEAHQDEVKIVLKGQAVETIPDRVAPTPMDEESKPKLTISDLRKKPYTTVAKVAREHGIVTKDAEGQNLSMGALIDLLTPVLAEE